VSCAGRTAPGRDTQTSGLWPRPIRLLSWVCVHKKGFCTEVSSSRVPSCRCLSVVWGMVGCAPLIHGALILCCIRAWSVVGSGAAEPHRCPAKGPGASGNLHSRWHRRPCVLTLARHLSLPAQKNIIEPFYCLAVAGSCAIRHTRNSTGRELQTSG